MKEDIKNPLKISSQKSSTIVNIKETETPAESTPETPAESTPETPKENKFLSLINELNRRRATSNKAATSFEDLLNRRKGTRATTTMFDELARRKTLFKK